MKKTIITLIASLTLALGTMFSAQAVTEDEQSLIVGGAGITYMIDAVPAAVVAGSLVYMLTHSEIEHACFNEPARTVAHVNNPNGYTFQVSGCDYQANQNRLVLVQ